MTQRQRLDRSLTLVLAFTGPILIFLGLSLLWLLYAPIRAPYVILNPGEHSAQTFHDAVLLRREFEIRSGVELRIEREFLSQQADGSLLRVTLPRTEIYYPPGTYKIKRAVELPDMPAGTYEIHNRVCWKVNFLRWDCRDLPVLSTEIQEPVR